MAASGTSGTPDTPEIEDDDEDRLLLWIALGMAGVGALAAAAAALWRRARRLPPLASETLIARHRGVSLIAIGIALVGTAVAVDAPTALVTALGIGGAAALILGPLNANLRSLRVGWRGFELTLAAQLGLDPGSWPEDADPDDPLPWPGRPPHPDPG